MKEILFCNGRERDEHQTNDCLYDSMHPNMFFSFLLGFNSQILFIKTIPAYLCVCVKEIKFNT